MMKSSIECYPFRQTQHNKKNSVLLNVPNYHLNVDLYLTNFEMIKR